MRVGRQPDCWGLSIFLDGKLHGIHHEVRAIGYANSIVVGKEVVAKFVSKCAYKVAGNKTLDCRRDSEESLFGGI